MPDISPRLSLPYLLPSQAQKHVTHNQALDLLDVLAQLNVLEFDADTPPALPVDGDVFALGAAPTGVWAGRAEKLAVFNVDTWVFLTPREGWQAANAVNQSMSVFSGGAWVTVRGETQNLDGIGIGTQSDAINRLSVAAPATLLSHAGSDHQLKINKASTGDTASLLMQTNWSGRAEIGLAGDDDFSVKVSDDGSSWTTGLKISGGTGAVTSPQFASGIIDIEEDTVGVIPTPSSGGFVMLTMVGEIYPQANHSGIFVYDTGASLNLVSMTLGTSMVNLGTSALAGTTGTDGDSSVAVQSGGLQIENRFNGSRQYSYVFLGGN